MSAQPGPGSQWRVPWRVCTGVPVRLHSFSRCCPGLQAGAAAAWARRRSRPWRRRRCARGCSASWRRLRRRCRARPRRGGAPPARGRPAHERGGSQAAQQPALTARQTLPRAQSRHPSSRAATRSGGGSRAGPPARRRASSRQASAAARPATAASAAGGVLRRPRRCCRRCRRLAPARRRRTTPLRHPPLPKACQSWSPRRACRMQRQPRPAARRPLRERPLQSLQRRLQ